MHWCVCSLKDAPIFFNPIGILFQFTLEKFWGKKWASKQKCIAKINFIRTNRIQGDDVNHRGWLTIFWSKMVKMLSKKVKKWKKWKNYYFQFFFSTYLHVFLLKFGVAILVGWGIQFHIQRLPTRHNFCGHLSMKNEKYMKKCDVDIQHHIFHVFLIFHGAGSTKSMSSGYSLVVELYSLSSKWSYLKFE